MRSGSRSTSRGRSTGLRGRCCGTTPPRPATSSRAPTVSRGPAAKAGRRAIAGSSRPPWATSASAGVQLTGRHTSENAPSATQSPGSVAVTLPIHPFCGRLFVLIRSFTSAADGRRYVQIEGPQREMIVLPEEWTDRGPSCAPPQLDGREVLLSARGLVELAGAVADVLDRARRPPQESTQGKSKPLSGPVDAKAPDRPTRSTPAGRAANRRAARPAGRVDDTRTQSRSGRHARGGRP